MKTNLKTVVAALIMASSGAMFAQSVVYDNLSTGATAGYSEANANNPIFGDALALTQGGILSSIGLSLFNSSSGGNTGSILTGTMVVKFYDNTVAYGGGSLAGTLPLLGSATLSWDFTGSGGLGAGFYTTGVFDLSALNISLTQNIFVTQQFTETSGTSTRNGLVLLGNPTVGSSPANVYLNSTATAEGIYTFGGGNPNQFAYQITIVPEPATLALAGVGAASLLLFRRRK